jgi:hypothetical protein
MARSFLRYIRLTSNNSSRNEFLKALPDYKISQLVLNGKISILAKYKLYIFFNLTSSPKSAISRHFNQLKILSTVALKGILDKHYACVQLPDGKLGELVDLVSKIGFGEI